MGRGLAAPTSPFQTSLLELLNQKNALFKNDSFEPMLATLSFFPWLVLWYAVDMHMPSARRFRIQPNNTSMHQWEVGCRDCPITRHAGLPSHHCQCICLCSGTAR